jgi:hypothetical protein
MARRRSKKLTIRGEATAPKQCTETLYTTYGLGRERIQGTLYAGAQNGTRAGLGEQTLPYGLAHTNSNGPSQIPGAARLLGRQSFGGTIASLPASVFFLYESGRGALPTTVIRIVNRRELSSLEVTPLRDETKERWRELCERVISEQDPDRFEATIRELLKVLEGREEMAPPRDRVYVPPSEKLINISSQVS